MGKYYFLLFLLFPLTNCGVSDPQAATALLKKVRSENYRSWQRAPGYATRRKATGPHGTDVEIFVNDTISAALARPGLTSWPVGSLIVKDVFTGDTQTQTAIMEKHSDGWYFAEYSMDDTATTYGLKPLQCATCHQAGADFVRSFPF